MTILTPATHKADFITSIIEKLLRIADTVVLIGDDTLGRVSKISALYESSTVNMLSFDIQPLNNGLRERLAQQWFSTTGETGITESESSGRLKNAAWTLDTIIGRNYVPAYPIYVIAVLQAFEDGSSVDMRASTHGYFYEIDEQI